MKVLLINPPKHNIIQSTVPAIISRESGYYPPLGLMYIAAYAEKYTENNIKILDTQVEEMSYSQIKLEIKKEKPDVVGIHAMTFTLIDALLMARMAKDINNDIKVVFGGPHINIYPNESISMKEVDYLVLGEGERSFTNLLINIDDIEKLKNIPGLVFKDNEKIINTGLGDLISDLDVIPFPARHLTPYKKYTSLLAKRNPITTMMSSRGCPHKCIFCGRQHLGKKFRARSAGNVVDEMEECAHMGIKEFFFYDDTFAINKKRVIDICDEISERGLDIGWDIRTRVDSVDRELLKGLKSAGCERIHYGVESGNPEMLKTLRKGITKEQAQEAFKMTKEAGIQTLAYFMIGLPGETRLQVMDTLKFARSLKPDFVLFSLLTPFPATPLYEEYLGSGQINEDYWREFAKNPKKEFIPKILEDNLTEKELTDLLRVAYKDYYLNINYIAKQILKMRSIEEFKKKAKAGLRLLTI